MILNRYVAAFYLKYVLLILFALTLFFVGIDFIQHGDELPDSANMQILYIAYDFMYATQFTLPISLLLGTVVAMVLLVRSHELGAMLALGYSKKHIARQFLSVSLVLTALYVTLYTTEYAYAKQKAESILDNTYLFDSKNDLFLKYADYYVYFGKVYPLQKRAEDVRVYELIDRDVRTIIKGEEAEFVDNQWQIKEARIIRKPMEATLGSTPLTIEEQKKITILEGFRPAILDHVFEDKASLSIPDAIEAINLLSLQGVNTDKVRSILYMMLLFPWFAPLMGLGVIYHYPSLHRYANLGLHTFLSIVFALLGWGLFYSLGRLSSGGMLPPEGSIILPLVALLGLFLYYYKNLEFGWGKRQR